MKKRIGIFGGTFDPIHCGHLRVAEEVRELMSLEKVIFVPAYIQPLKDVGSASEADHRLEMVRLAVGGNNFFEIDDCEMQRGGSSYTVDTLDYFRAESPNADLSLIIGADAWQSMTLWRDYERLFDLAHVVVMSRPGYEAAPPEEVLGVEAAKRLCYDGSENRESCGGVGFVTVTWLDISGTGIRRRCREGKSIKYLTPEAVEKYIKDHKLYV